MCLYDRGLDDLEYQADRLWERFFPAAFIVGRLTAHRDNPTRPTNVILVLDARRSRLEK